MSCTLFGFIPCGPLPLKSITTGLPIDCIQFDKEKIENYFRRQIKIIIIKNMKIITKSKRILTQQPILTQKYNSFSYEDIANEYIDYQMNLCILQKFFVLEIVSKNKIYIVEPLNIGFNVLIPVLNSNKKMKITIQARYVGNQKNILFTIREENHNFTDNNFYYHLNIQLFSTKNSYLYKEFYVTIDVYDDVLQYLTYNIPERVVVKIQTKYYYQQMFKKLIHSRKKYDINLVDMFTFAY
ncbi:hypothetical protein HZS_4674 [Henneguya salminicola]|nr:hypothetical protein HZS_4674 [Henneguya salminicola]